MHYRRILDCSPSVQKREEHLRLITDNIPVLISHVDRTGDMAQVGGWEIDLETRKVFWTQTTARIHELPDEY